MGVKKRLPTLTESGIEHLFPKEKLNLLELCLHELRGEPIILDNGAECMPKGFLRVVGYG